MPLLQFLKHAKLISASTDSYVVDKEDLKKSTAGPKVNLVCLILIQLERDLHMEMYLRCLAISAGC